MDVDIQAETAKTPGRSSKERLHRAAIILILTMVLLVACFYMFENWRGNRAWVQYCASTEARGESLGVASRTPEIEARAQASITCAKELQELSRGFDTVWSQYIRPLPSSPYGQFENLSAWRDHASAVKSGQTNKQPNVTENRGGQAARAAAAAAILECLPGQDAFMDKLQSACQRPKHIYPFGYDGPPVFKWGCQSPPRAYPAITACQYLKVKMTAALALGRTTEALRDFQLTLDLSNCLRADGSMLASMVGIHCRKLALTPLWAGLAERRFTDMELRKIQQLLVSADPITEFYRVCLAERNQILALCEWVQRTGNYSEFGDHAVDSAFALVPPGWMQLEKVNYAKRFDAIIGAAFSDERKRIHLGTSAGLQERTLRELQRDRGLRAVLHHTAIAAIVIPTRLADFASDCASTQVIGDHIRLACSLERFYLQHARYPEKLAQLVPECIPQLPTDPLSGEGYQYAVDGNGRYRLWSVGPDEIDNGGLQGEEPYRYSRGPGDWVWCYPDK